jgi:hypothetical protein
MLHVQTAQIEALYKSNDAVSSVAHEFYSRNIHPHNLTILQPPAQTICFVLHCLVTGIFLYN